MTVGDRTGRPPDAGAATSELAISVPALVLLLLLVAFGGRLGQAEQDVTQATAEAARAASLTRGDATPVARRTVEANLAAAGVACAALQVQVDGDPPTAGATVRVRTRCDVDMTGVAGLGLPRRRSVRAMAVEVVDTYRGG
jgi:Flp pilus assembly protein TadG